MVMWSHDYYIHALNVWYSFNQTHIIVLLFYIETISFVGILACSNISRHMGTLGTDFGWAGDIPSECSQMHPISVGGVVLSVQIFVIYGGDVL